MTGGAVRRRVILGFRVMTSWRATESNLLDLIRSLLTSYVALGITIWILPDVHVGGPIALLVLVVVVAAVGLLIRPALLGLAVVLGPAGLLLGGILAQAIVLDVALAAIPHARTGPFLDVLIASWIAAAIAALVNWLFDVGSEDAFLSQVLGRAIRVAHRHTRVTGAGLLIVQLDGLSEPLLRQAITAGSVPTLSRWLRSGTHELRRWHTGLPATTPGGQSVLLHGNVTAVPSFRWYEKETARLVVANRPRDAAEIERRMSNGRGLLADGGVSVSNLFSGDAPTKILTMSDAHLPARSTRGLATFATAPGGLIRSLVVFLAEMVTELQQARRQRRRDVQPRVHRGGIFVILRAVSTVLLRDLNVTIVAEQMARSAPVIFVDFIDYDEVAHHAGPSRPESMRTLDGLDRVLRLFEQVAVEVGRQYELVVLSDHGQAQGATFAQLAGFTLHEVVAGLLDDAEERTEERRRENVDSSPAEQWGPANLLLTGAARIGTMAGGATRGVLRGRAEKDADAGSVSVALGKPRDSTPMHASVTGEHDEVPAPVVTAAGSMAHIYLPDLPGRIARDLIDARHPRLIEGLAAHPNVGAVIVRNADTGALVALGNHGWRELRNGLTAGGEGQDPLAVFGPHAAADVLALETRDHVGDIVVFGAFDPQTGAVTAFEELVGSHGGLGGGQTSAVFLHPAAWEIPVPGTLDGETVHEVLLNRLRELGLREVDVPETAVPETAVSVP
jgi:hypothetical protein